MEVLVFPVPIENQSESNPSKFGLSLWLFGKVRIYFLIVETFSMILYDFLWKEYFFLWSKKKPFGKVTTLLFYIVEYVTMWYSSLKKAKY